MNATTEKFESWAILELMGHRKLAGFVQETEIAAGKFLRIDVPDAEGKLTTQFYAPGSVYCITPTTEEIVKAYAARNTPSPISRYELTFPKPENVQDASYSDSGDYREYDDNEVPL